MKNILLSTTALTLTAGIAAAEVSVTGSFTLGFNDTLAAETAMVGTAAVAPTYSPTTGLVTAAGTLASVASAGPPATLAYVAAVKNDNNYGVYNDAGINFAMSSTMDNGMAVSATLDMNGSDTDGNVADAYTLALASDGLNVTFGSTQDSAISAWKSSGQMSTDGWRNQADAGGNVLKADATVGGLAISASANVISGAAAAAPDAVSIAISGGLGGATYVIANEGSLMGISVATAMGGSTVTSAYSTDGTDTSTGVKIAYPMGSVTTTASYVVESAVTDTWDLAAAYTGAGTTLTVKTDEDKNNSVEGTMTLGAATVSAGLSDKLNDMYLAVSNPLGGGATIMASYAIDGTGSADAKDEIGAGDWQEGLTVELKFAF